MGEVYLTVERFKLASRIKTKSEDGLIKSVIEEANTQVNAIISPYANNIPLIAGDAISEMATELALTHAKYGWQRDYGQFERAELLQREFMAKSRSLIAVLKSHRTTRTKTVFVTDDPRNKNLLLPSQKTKAIFGSF